MSRKLEAVIFDIDGVIADTEKDGHRVAFNQVFEEEGLDVRWDVEKYGVLLKIAGGKERLKTLVYGDEFKRDVPDKEEYILKMHKRKTQIYKDIVAQGRLPGRSGIKRLVKEARENGLKLGVASTSQEESVRAVIKIVLGENILKLFDIILAGDVVKQKKPSPEIYHLSSSRLNVASGNCVVVEDTRNGLLSAKGAGMACVITPSYYSGEENFDEADLVVSGLGDPDGEVVHLIKSRVALPDFEYVTIDILKKLFQN